MDGKELDTRLANFSEHCYQNQKQCPEYRRGRAEEDGDTQTHKRCRTSLHNKVLFPSRTKMLIIVLIFTLLLLLQLSSVDAKRRHKGKGGREREKDRDKDRERNRERNHERNKNNEKSSRKKSTDNYLIWNVGVRDKIEHFINVTIQCRDIVGLNIAIVTKDDTLLTKGYGCMDLPGCKPATEETLFSLASVTKAFTITLLAQILKEKGKTIDTPVRELLGEDFYFWDGLRSSQVTVRDLAAHRTGIPNNNNMRMQDPMTREILAKKTRFLEPAGEFRNSHIYNNLMYGLISYISERETNRSWEDLLRERIFYPLGMNDTTFSHEVLYNMSNVATSYLPYENRPREVSPLLHSYWGELGGSGSILSNARDMANWLKLQLNGGKASCDEQVIDKDILELSHTPVVPIPITNMDQNWRKPKVPYTYDHHQYALGWRVGYYRDSRQILHTGTSWGYGALVTIRPDDNLAIYTSITGVDDGYTGRRMIHMYIMDLVLGEEPWFNTTNSCTFPEPWGPPYRQRMYPGYFSKLFRDRKAKARLAKSKYNGVYGNYAYGNVTVHYNESMNKLELLYGKYGRWYLHCKRGNDFAGEGYGVFWARELRSVLFRNSKGGKSSVDEVVISFENRDPPVFVRGLVMATAPPPPNPDYIGRPAVGRAPTIRTNSILILMNPVLVLALLFLSSIPSYRRACCIL